MSDGLLAVILCTVLFGGLGYYFIFTVRTGNVTCERVCLSAGHNDGWALDDSCKCGDYTILPASVMID